VSISLPCSLRRWDEAELEGATEGRESVYNSEIDTTDKQGQLVLGY